MLKVWFFEIIENGSYLSYYTLGHKRGIYLNSNQVSHVSLHFLYFLIFYVCWLPNSLIIFLIFALFLVCLRDFADVEILSDKIR